METTNISNFAPSQGCVRAGERSSALQHRGRRPRRRRSFPAGRMARWAGYCTVTVQRCRRVVAGHGTRANPANLKVALSSAQPTPPGTDTAWRVRPPLRTLTAPPCSRPAGDPGRGARSRGRRVGCTTAPSQSWWRVTRLLQVSSTTTSMPVVGPGRWRWRCWAARTPEERTWPTTTSYAARSWRPGTTPAARRVPAWRETGRGAFGRRQARVQVQARRGRRAQQPGRHEQAEHRPRTRSRW